MLRNNLHGTEEDERGVYKKAGHVCVRACVRARMRARVGGGGGGVGGWLCVQLHLRDCASERERETA